MYARHQRRLKPVRPWHLSFGASKERYPCRIPVVVVARHDETMVAENSPYQQVDAEIHQRIVEQMPLAVVVWWAETDDPRDLRLVYTSPRGTAETGADMTQFVGTRFSESFPTAYETDLPDRYFAVATGSEPEYQEVIRYGDETIAENWFRVDARPLARRCVLVSYTNITQQQEVANRPARRPAPGMAVSEISELIGAAVGNVEQWLYQRIVEQMPLAVVVWWAETNDPRDLRMVYCGPHSTAVTGTDMTQFVGKRFSESFPVAYETDLPYRIFAVATGSRPDHFETFPYGDENVPDSWFRVEVQPMGQGCALVAYTNITEQHQAAASLRRRRREAATLAEIGRVISASLDIQHVYAALTTSVRQLIPYDRLAIATVDLDQNTITSVYNSKEPITDKWAIGRPHALRGVASESVVHARTPLLMQAATEAELLAKFPTAREGLEHGVCSTIVVPLIARDEVIGVLTIRARKMSAFTQHHLVLAQQVGMQIAGAIANAWAYAALKDAEAALVRSNAELEQFAYVASHDLQEPLRVVGSYVQLLARRYSGQLDGRADRYITRSLAGVERMRALINDLLTYSRVGTRGLELTPLRTETVVAEVLEGLAVTIRETAAEITWDPLPVVQADSTQVGQLFQNLLANALKYRSEQAPRVHIGVERQGQWWRFAVQDNGIGIDPAYAERIFLVFQRLHTRDEYPGTGIGLALCQKIVERHGGQLTVESQVGQGATFFFTLPAVERWDG